jgi:hypothetical protein
MRFIQKSFPDRKLFLCLPLALSAGRAVLPIIHSLLQIKAQLDMHPIKYLCNFEIESSSAQ